MTVAPSVPVVDRYLLDEPEASVLCGVSRNTFRSWVAAGYIRPVELPPTTGGRPKRRVLYLASDVRTFAESLPKMRAAS